MTQAEEYKTRHHIFYSSDGDCIGEALFSCRDSDLEAHLKQAQEYFEFRAGLVKKEQPK